jgi:hypothetical protein
MLLDSFHSSHFSFEAVAPAFQEIQRYLKVTETDEEYPVNSAIRKIIPELWDNPGITGGYTIRKAEDLTLDAGSQIRHYMKGATYWALFVCTAGPLFTSLTKRYNREGDYLEAFVTDAIGSLTVEKAMDKIQAQLEQSMNEERLNISNRYSPGYCNWPLSGQQALFEAAGTSSLPVSLTESCLMTPIKSISGIIGIGENIRKRAYACKICKNESCTYRRVQGVR